MVSPWPVSGPPDETAERELELIMSIVREVRTVRSEYGADPGKYISATVAAGDHLPTIASNVDTIRRLARLQPLALHQVLTDRPAQSVTLLVGDVALYLPLGELTDVERRFEQRCPVTADKRKDLHALFHRCSSQASCPAWRCPRRTRRRPSH